MNGIDATMFGQLVKHLVGHTKADGDGEYVGRGFSGEHMQSDVPIGQRGWLGNPFEIGERIEIGGTVVAEEATRAEVVEAFQTVFIQRLKEDAEFRRAVRDLAGEPVDCWCQHRGEVGPACHGGVIVTIAMWLANRAR